MWRIFCDGTALPKGTIAIGALLIAPNGDRHTLSRRAEEKGCSNAAEALALIAALERARELGARDLAISCDNSIVIAETVGTTRTQVPRLAPLYARARALLSTFDHAALHWVPRHQNGDADVLARSALGLAPKPYVPNNRRLRARVVAKLSRER